MIDHQYETLLQDVLENGTIKTDRTGVGTRSITGATLRYDIRSGIIPLLTTKKIHWKSVIGELLWMLSGSTSANELREKYGVTIWDEWADERGNLGPIYGAQWREWVGVDAADFTETRGTVTYIDQIKELLAGLKDNPTSRRHLISAWNPAEIPAMALAPCHFAWQVISDGENLDLVVYQRSADIFLGVPFNIASYATLAHMLGQVTGLKPRTLVWHGGDVHLYQNHESAAVEQLGREARMFPMLVMSSDVTDLFEFVPEDFTVVGYNPHPAIKAEVAV